MENTTLIPMTDIERMGTAIAQSGLFGMKTSSQAIALMLIAQAEGLHPAVAARDYDIIQGRPALKAKAKLGRFQKAGGKFEWLKRTDTEVSAKFSHPACPNPVIIEWTLERARVAGLGGKDNWKKYPRQMLSARVISEGVDATYPDAGSNMYVPEEVQDFEPVTPVITTAEVIETIPEKKEEPIQEVLPDEPLPEKCDEQVQQSPQQCDNKISEAQVKRLFAIYKTAGISEERLKDIITKHGFTSRKDITRDKYDVICKEIADLPF